MIEYKLKTTPVNTPVSLAEAKELLRYYGTEQDNVIQSHLDTALTVVESLSYRRLITQTWEIICNTWAEAQEVIKFGQLQSVTSVKYLDEDEAEQTVSTDDYKVSGVGTDKGCIVFYSDGDFDYPSVFEVEPITIEFICGYGDDAADVPEPFKTAIKLLVQDAWSGTCNMDVVEGLMYQNRVWDFYV